MDDATPRPIGARRFGLLDVMILVGSVAAGFAGLRAGDPGSDWGEIFRSVASKFTWDREYFGQVVPELIFFATPPAMATTSGVLALRLRKPRPRWRSLRRQPGIVACLAVILSWALVVPIAAKEVLNSTSPPVVVPDFTGIFLAGSVLGGFAVILAWSTLALVGRWRPEPSWPDRLGRLVGLSWIALALVGGFVFLVVVF